MKLSHPPRQVQKQEQVLLDDPVPIDLPPEEELTDSKALINDPLSDDSLFGEDLGFGLDGGGGIPAMEKHSDLLKGLTNFDKYVKDKVNGWLGLIWDSNEKKYVQNKNITPVMNGKCAAWCIDFLKTYTRDNNIITNIGRDEYINIMEDVIDVTWLNLGTRYDEFGIENNGDILRIATELEHSAALVLMGAGDGKYNALLTETVNRTENVNYSAQQPMMYGGMPMPGGMMGEPQQHKKVGFLGSIKNKLIGKT